ncbi:unnamed protein product [Somion occarium]|uniref:Ribosomal RNA-processing protein 8 n=1 Tax=Somion occarium TaxID=3059160 RepID=A0ABP1D343_9APHY
MALFEVPGWTVPSAPLPSASRKRKRGAPDTDKVSAAEVNVEQLIAKIGTGQGHTDTPKKKQKTKGKQKAKEHGSASRNQPSPSSKAKGAKVVQHEDSKRVEVAASSSSSGKKSINQSKKNRKTEGSQTTPKVAPETKKTKLDTQSGLTAMQANMKHSLDGARFRWINETLYKSDSQHAHEMMRENPNVFSEYHTGFRHQVQSWPSNPVGHYISVLSSYPPKTVIADLGCGDATLARGLVPKGLNVLSFDLVSDGSYVVEADICSKIPLPGSEQDSEEDGAQIVDVVVCALSLMGINWPTCIREVWRVLRNGGELKIAEVASRFTDIDAFISLVTSVGFKLRSKDDNNTHFTLFEFVKVPRQHKSEKDWEKIEGQGSLLKPCEYKRR